MTPRAAARLDRKASTTSPSLCRSRKEHLYANLQGAQLSDADLQAAQLGGASLQCAGLNDAKLTDQIE